MLLLVKKYGEGIMEQNAPFQCHHESCRLSTQQNKIEVDNPFTYPQINKSKLCTDNIWKKPC